MKASTEEITGYVTEMKAICRAFHEKGQSETMIKIATAVAAIHQELKFISIDHENMVCCQTSILLEMLKISYQMGEIHE